MQTRIYNSTQNNIQKHNIDTQLKHGHSTQGNWNELNTRAPINEKQLKPHQENATKYKNTKLREIAIK
jgi:hypothetical protein